jgi:DNA-directed RNA polymerase subunit RPC12/RpoP
MGKRYKFKCWNCERIYSLFKEITGEQELIIACPFCNEEAVVKLDPYKHEKKPVMRIKGEGEQSVGFVYRFPAVIPTSKPE